MSGAAVDAARRVAHPAVKGSRRALLDTVAALIPEGQDMTAPIADDELAARIGYDERTVRRSRTRLSKVGLLRVAGGQGRLATYGLGVAAGGAGAPPALPLIGAAKPPAPRRSSEPSLQRDLLAPPPSATDELIRVDTVGQNVRSGVPYFGHFVRSWFADFGRFVRSGVWYFGHFVRSTRMDVGGTRARAVPPLKESTTTTTAPAARDTLPHEAPPKARPCKWHGRSHGWCAWRVHVPMDLHLEERAKLARLPGQTDADLDAVMFARYAAIAAAIPDDQAITDTNEFEFWKQRLRASAPARDRAAPPSREAPARRRPDVAISRPCPHQPECVDPDVCIDRQVKRAVGGRS